MIDGKKIKDLNEGLVNYVDGRKISGQIQKEE